MSDPHIINNTIYDSQAILKLVRGVRKLVVPGYATTGVLQELKIRYINDKRKPDRWGGFGPYFAWAGWKNQVGELELGIVRRGGVGGNALVWLAESADSDELHLPQEVVRDICRVIYRKFSRTYRDDVQIDQDLTTTFSEWPTILMNEKAAGRKEYALQKAKSEVVKYQTNLAKSLKLVGRAKRALNRHENAREGAKVKLLKAKNRVEVAESTLAKSKENVEKKAKTLADSEGK